MLCSETTMDFIVTGSVTDIWTAAYQFTVHVSTCSSITQTSSYSDLFAITLLHMTMNQFIYFLLRGVGAVLRTDVRIVLRSSACTTTVQ